MARYLHRINWEDYDRIGELSEKYNIYPRDLIMRMSGAKLIEHLSILYLKNPYTFYINKTRFVLNKDTILSFNEELEDNDEVFLYLTNKFIEDFMLFHFKSRNFERKIHNSENIIIDMEKRGTYYNSFFYSDYKGYYKEYSSLGYGSEYLMGFADYCEMLMGVENMTFPENDKLETFRGYNYFKCNAFTAFISDKKRYVNRLSDKQRTIDIKFKPSILAPLNERLEQFRKWLIKRQEQKRKNVTSQ